MSDTACGLCGEESFPTAPAHLGPTMGLLHPLSVVPDRVKRAGAIPEGADGWLCGNCWHDLLDLVEERAAR